MEWSVRQRKLQKDTQVVESSEHQKQRHRIQRKFQTAKHTKIYAICIVQKTHLTFADWEDNTNLRWDDRSGISDCKKDPQVTESSEHQKQQSGIQRKFTTPSEFCTFRRWCTPQIAWSVWQRRLQKATQVVESSEHQKQRIRIQRKFQTAKHTKIYAWSKKPIWASHIAKMI